MTNDYYKQAFDAAIDELTALAKQYEEMIKEEEVLEDRMEKVRSGALSLATLANLDFQKIQDEYPDLFGGQPDPRIGITEAVREVLRSFDEMVTPIQIREGVFRISPSIAGHKNPLASIHAVLRRLMDSTQVLVGTDEDGKASYGWIDCEDWEDRVSRWVSNPEETIAKTKAKRKKKK